MLHDFNMVQLSIIFNLLFSFFISFFLTSFLIPFCIKLAFKFKIIDNPDGKLKIHEKITPYLGGVAIYVSVLFVLLFKFNFGYNSLIFFISVTLLMILGLVDDIIVISPLHKLFGQAACVFFLSLFCSNLLFIYDYVGKYLSFSFNMFWCLSIINAFNLIDVMDGLCSITAITSTISFLLISLIFNQVNIAILLVIFLGALTSFFLYNAPPARIYLGDSGSLFIGGVLSLIPFLINWPSRFMAISSSFLVLAVPILELVSLIVIRLYKKIPFYLGSPDHFSIILKKKGWSKKEILIYVALINIFLAFVVILNVLNCIFLLQMLLLTFFVLLIWFCILLF